MSLEELQPRTIKAVYNDTYGGFSISEEAVAWLNAQGHKKVTKYSYRSASQRSAPELVQVVETLGSERASGKHARLAIETFENTSLNAMKLHEYDGLESIDFAKNKWLCQALSYLTPDNANEWKQIALTVGKFNFDSLNPDTCQVWKTAVCEALNITLKSPSPVVVVDENPIVLDTSLEHQNDEQNHNYDKVPETSTEIIVPQSELRE
jgi:hypothetical protein